MAVVLAAIAVILIPIICKRELNTFNTHHIPCQQDLLTRNLTGQSAPVAAIKIVNELMSVLVLYPGLLGITICHAHLEQWSHAVI